MRPFSFQKLHRVEVIQTSKPVACMTRSLHWRSVVRTPKRNAERVAAYAERMAEKNDYTSWSHEKLIERVTELENELKLKNLSLIAQAPAHTEEKKSWKKPRIEREFDPSKYSTRLVALKLAYLGKRYNGFEHHTGQVTPLPTIEEELWKALNKARLIFPKDTNPIRPGEVDWTGTDYSKCGRTDKGVSAFGQVIGIRVRSNRPLGKKKAVEDGTEVERELSLEEEDIFNTLPRDGAMELSSPPLSPSRSPALTAQVPVEEDEYDYDEALDFDPIADEIQYPSVLNRLLPPDIRILAWCPSPPLDFSARFSCRERQYRYFFTQPAFAPTPKSLVSPTQGSTLKDGWLDIEAMRTAAKYFEGHHDFRNFCKVDGGKQIENFERRIFKADIEEVEDESGALAHLNSEDFLPEGQKGGNPKVYTFTLHGSAFLWHQVRCMVSILFLVAQGLEKPELVKELLDVKANPRRPTYEMATDTPLVLWDCIFPHEDDPDRKDAMQWIYIGDGRGAGDSKYGVDGLMQNLWKLWRGRKIDEMLAGSLINVVTKQGTPVKELEKGGEGKGNRSQKVFDGGDVPRLQGSYIPVMKKPKMDVVEVINLKYAVRKGFESSEEMKSSGYRTLDKEGRKAAAGAVDKEAGDA